MARATTRMVEYLSDEDLPDLHTLLPPRTTTTLRTRRSPPKQTTAIGATQSSIPAHVREPEATIRKVARAEGQNLYSKRCPAKLPSPVKHSVATLVDVPVILRPQHSLAAFASSKNGLSRSPIRRSLKLTHVDSLLLPLSQIALGDDIKASKEGEEEKSRPRLQSKVERNSGGRFNGLQSNRRQQDVRTVSKSVSCASRFILKEAKCDEDVDDSQAEDVEEEETDLSGFIVSDEAELTIYESGSESELGVKTAVTGQVKRKMLSSRSSGQRYDGSDKENVLKDDLLGAIRDMVIGNTRHESSKSQIETVDLTSSPPNSSRPDCERESKSSSRAKGEAVGKKKNQNQNQNQNQEMADLSNPFDDSDAVLKISPPRSHFPAKVPTKVKPSSSLSTEDDDRGYVMDSPCRGDRFTTPPASPPRSPSKLKSPSKLFSPRKNKNTTPRSPHRQSVDGFWDLDVVNTWNDTYSPKKAPLINPCKNVLPRFSIWSDSEEEDNMNLSKGSNDSSDSLASPCSSPRKSASPVKAEKMRLAAEKKAATAKKRAFDSMKEQVAIDLLQDLDANITGSKLTTMSCSTGGVKIVWSNGLRSTAGRANWKVSVTKPSGSPMKSTATITLVQHYASIELASKIIDCESRLVNTLAHEFCHLANFMVSGVRDQPHGTSFKMWASKVTTYLQQHNNVMYRSVEVTTKHSYKIDHKYVWVCVGKPQSEAMRYLNIVPEEGCGAEYGRHSKSINVESQRCGKCKGRLLQVKPKPRKMTMNTKDWSPRKGLFGRKVEKIEEENGICSSGSSKRSVEFIDLTD